MFGIVADLLCTVATILFPIFASYKALRTSDPAQVAPWLMYWVVVSFALTVESFFSFILSWVPFYSWLRLFAYLYLILPGQQGATFLYLEHLEPFLHYHEAEIDNFITKTHDRAKAAGLQYFQQAIEYVRVKILGFQPSPPPQRGAPAGSTYMQTILSRFSIPAARSPASAGPAGDIYSLVTQALSGAATGPARNSLGADVSSLFPPEVRNANERDQLSYVAQQRDRINSLLQAFDREAYNLGSAPDDRRRGGAAELGKSRSELDFDRIDRDEAASAAPIGAPPPYPMSTGMPEVNRRESGGWMPWNWNAGAPARPQVPPDATPPTRYSGEYTRDVREEEEAKERERARRRRDREERRREAESSGLDYGY